MELVMLRIGNRIAIIMMAILLPILSITSSIQ